MPQDKTEAWVVALTPFHADGGLDHEGLRRHLRRMTAAGQSVYLASTNIGEGFALSPDEIGEVYRIGVEECRGRTGVRAAGRESRSVAEALSALRIAEAAGVDAFHLFQLDVGHASAKPDAAEQERFYRSVLDRTGLPIVLSNYPALGYAVPVDLLARLTGDYPQIVAIRDTSGDPGYLAALAARCAPQVRLYTVGPRSLLNGLLQGSRGVMTTEGNIAPRLIRAALDAFDMQDLAALRDRFGLWHRLAALLNAHGGSGGRGMKAALAAFGLMGPTLRAPRAPISDESRAELVAKLRALLPDEGLAA